MQNIQSIHLQIEHKVSGFEEWGKAFDSDPINRKKAGVRRYKIFQRFDNQNYVTIDLEFDNIMEEQNALTALLNLWTTVEGKIIMNPQTRILNLAEAAEITE